MKISGNDLILLGLCFGIASALILGKGYVFKDIDAILDESTSYYGKNPHVVRNRIIQKWEGIAGVVLIIPFAILQLLGIYLNVAKPKIESILLNPLYNLIFLILFTLCLIWGSNLISSSIAKQKYTPVLRDLVKEGFLQTEYVLKNDGLYEEEQNRSQDISREVRDKRLADMQRRLKNWERLFNFKRKPNEPDIDYFLRLKRNLNKEEN